MMVFLPFIPADVVSLKVLFLLLCCLSCILPLSLPLFHLCLNITFMLIMGVDPWVDRGTCPPYFLKRPVFCPPLLFWEQTLFVMHSTDCRISDSAKTVTRIIG